MKPDSRYLDLEMNVEVWLATERVPLERLLALEPGGVLPLSHDPDGPVDLVINGARVAAGELVVVDGRFGFRVTGTRDEPIAEATANAVAAVAAAEADAGAAEEAPVPAVESDDIDRPAEEGDTP